MDDRDIRVELEYSLYRPITSSYGYIGFDQVAVLNGTLECAESVAVGQLACRLSALRCGEKSWIIEFVLAYLVRLG